jgi:hypothetical protein
MWQSHMDPLRTIYLRFGPNDILEAKSQRNESKDHLSEP